MSVDLSRDSDTTPRLAPEVVIDSVVNPFEILNPYDVSVLPGPILQIQDVNLDASSRVQPVEAFVIGSKRYRLRSPAPERLLVDFKEHGLGHLLPPKLQDDDTDSRRAWFREWWDEIDGFEQDPERKEPDWFRLPLVGRHPITSLREEAAFRGHNEGRAYQGRVRPYNFLMSFHRDRLARNAKNSALLVAPFDRDPANWQGAEVFERSSRKSYRVQVESPYVVRRGHIPVQTYGDYFEEFRLHPETKLADAGGEPCHTWSRGPLAPRHLRAVQLSHIGKEAARLSQAHPINDHVLEYQEPGECGVCGKTLRDLRARFCSAACKQKAYRRRQRDQVIPRMQPSRVHLRKTT